MKKKILRVGDYEVAAHIQEDGSVSVGVHDPACIAGGWEIRRQVTLDRIVWWRPWTWLTQTMVGPKLKYPLRRAVELAVEDAERLTRHAEQQRARKRAACEAVGRFEEVGRAMADLERELAP